MTPEMITLLIYGIETASRLIKEGKMSEEEMKQAAIQEVLKFSNTMNQINDQIAKYSQ